MEVCRFNAPLTPGYWKNHLTFDNKHPDAPYAAKFLPQTIGNFTVTTTAQVTAVFNAMNCSNASSSSQNAVGCLAGHLLATKLNLANTANNCIQAAADKASSWLSGVAQDGVPGVNYTGPSNSYTLTQAQRNEAIALKNPLDKYNNGGGC